ncbi:MAG TPA: NAD(P)-dependent oxidoreductase [Acidimicrobiaceae bacterium]|nr:NAD(P)-dependent oxidoreductase [Acidimicrobiaceae bacterium]HCB37986.1 NAD(P)-dependent oxidoreductase [Acidimicrobiaceae bacterium]
MARLTRLSRSVAGRVTLVTGAGAGQGRATAHLFADEGAHVAVTDLGSAEVDAVVAEITDAGGRAAGWTMDVANRARVRTVVDEVAAHFGGIDHLVNNAGISRFAPIDSDDYDDHWTASLDVLLTAHTHTVRAALPYLRRSDAARIVNIASTEGWGATKFGSPYTAAKHGVIGLTKSLAVELGREAVTVNCICPGPIRTAMTADIPDEHKVIFAKRRTALGRYGEPEEVAHGTLNFCLPASQYMTGAVLPVDGGLLVKNA